MAGGGVGEAMLIGAAVGATAGGAGAAIQGGDPLKGAMLGGAMGAVGGGLGGAAGAGGAATEGALSGSTAGAGTGVTAGTTAAAPTSIGLGATGATNTGIGSLYAGAGQGIGTATNVGAGISGIGTGGGMGVTGGAPVLGSIAAPTTAGSIGSAGATGAGISGAGTGGGAGVTAGPGNFTGMAPQLSNTQLGMIGGTAGLGGLMQAERDQFEQPDTSYTGPLNKIKYDPDKFRPSNPIYAPTSVYRPTYAAEGGIMRLAQGGMPGPVEQMSQNMMGGRANMFPQSQQDQTQFATPTQMPASAEIIRSGYEAKTDPYTGAVTMARGGIARYDMGGIAGAAMGMPSGSGQANTVNQTSDQGIASLPNKKRMLTKEQMDAIRMQGMSPSALKDVYGQMAEKGLAAGGHLGGYSDGGRMLKGPGDGVSDSIPAQIGDRQPARLADGEFVIPARIVSELGNGSTDAGARRLYEMMDKVQAKRKKSIGKGKFAVDSKAHKYLPA